MDHLSNMSAGWLSPGSLVGAALLAVLFFVLASMVVVLIRGGARRVERHLSDVTALQFVSALMWKTPATGRADT